MSARLILAGVLAALLMSGCTSDNPTPAEWHKVDLNAMRTVCLDGVTYYLFRDGGMYSGFGYMSPKFGPDSKVVTCSQATKAGGNTQSSNASDMPPAPWSH